MKINISGLMSMISEYDKELTTLSYNLKKEVYNVSTQELNGTVTVVEDYKEDFVRDMERLENLVSTLTKLKAILYEKNNSFHLSDGRSIQKAIVDNSNLRFLANTYEAILKYRSSKTRCTEVNNSYFECKDLNFDIKEVRKKLETVKEKIHNTDLEISKLNARVFDIEI